MELKIIRLPEIAIIGREGLCTAQNNMVSQLWAQVNADFEQVQPLGMREKDGSFVGFWGAMSDAAMQFLPWEENYTRGLYLAGIEVTADKQAPEGWTKWVMPARTYLVADVEPGRYSEIFQEVISRKLPEMHLRLSGAVCDYTEPSTGKNKLFFPVENEQ